MIDYDKYGVIQWEARTLQDHAGREVRFFYSWPPTITDDGGPSREWLLLRHTISFADEVERLPILMSQFQTAMKDPATYAAKPGYTYSKGTADAIALNPARI